MTYLTQGEIADNRSMQVRVAQAYASENVVGGTDPDRWTFENRRDWASAPGWDAAWESAKVSNPPVDGEPAYDPGADESVVTDQMILSQVQAMIPAVPPE